MSYGYGNNPPRQPPSGEYGRPSPRPQPGGSYPSLGGNYSQQAPRPYGQQTRPTGGYPPQQQGRGGDPGDGSIMLEPIKYPGDVGDVYKNISAVCEKDFPQQRDQFYVIINDLYVQNVKKHTQCPPGTIGLSGVQRKWTKASLHASRFKVSVYDAFGQDALYLGSIAIEVDFASPQTSHEEYKHDQLEDYFKQVFSGQILAPGQRLMLDYQSRAPLELVVKGVGLTDLASMEKQGTGQGDLQTGAEVRGILFSQTRIDFSKKVESKINLKSSGRRPNAKFLVDPDFKFEAMGIGGLDTEFSAIFRRAFASRVFPPDLVESLGIQHVRGMLLYGPPGTGKTLIAREIGKMLKARPPKVINGPEVLNKYVGASEENIRKMFEDAEKEQEEKGDQSELHIIIFDELDAVCKQRGSGSGGGTGVGDSVVNQLLSKLDGVNQLNNILLIGMTNRMDMIDEALLRAGRLEVHIEISLPDEHGRQQILNIHTKSMRTADPCLMDKDVDLHELAKLTKNFSGAEISGLVKAASSFAFARHMDVDKLASVKADVHDLKVKRSDFIQALEEVKPLFGVSEEEIKGLISRDIIKFSDSLGLNLRDGKLLINQVRATDNATNMLSVLVRGAAATGKTALAAKMAIDSGAPFIKLISPSSMVGYSEMQKVSQFDKVFRDAYKSPMSVILIDNIELLIDWVDIGPRFSNTCLVALKALLERQPPKNHRLIVFATTSRSSVIDQVNLRFNEQIHVGAVQTQEELHRVLSHSGRYSDAVVREAQDEIRRKTGCEENINVGIKDVLLAVERAESSIVKGFATDFARAMKSKVEENMTDEQRTEATANLEKWAAQAAQANSHVRTRV